MPITYLHSSIFESDAEALVNPVNCAGAMGKGLAKAFKQRYPEMFRIYRELCRVRNMKVGRVVRVHLEDDQPQIILFPTKDHWTQPSHTYYIDSGLRHFCALLQHWDLKSVAFPALGCGLGGLDWNDVRPIMEQHLGNSPLAIRIHLPQFSDADKA